MFGRLIMSLVALALVAWLITFLPIPAPFGQIIYVVMILAAIYLVLVAFGVVSGPSWYQRPPL